MWWWNDYYWHMPWMFGPLVMLFFMACKKNQKADLGRVLINAGIGRISALGSEFNRSMQHGS
jgi:hypothetical protein